MWVKRENGWQSVEPLLLAVRRGPTAGYVTFGTMFEVELVSHEDARAYGMNAESLIVARRTLLVGTLRLRVEAEDELLRGRAAYLKSLGGLSRLDAYNIALAERLDAPLVHRDAEFDRFHAAGKAPGATFLRV